MPICETCKKLCSSAIARQCDDVLCNDCEQKRLDGLERERQQHQSRLSQSGESQGHQAASSPAADQPSQEASNDQRQNPSKPPKADTICLKECKLKNKKNIDYIRCCLCAQWYHDKCVGISPGETIGVWPCPNCRNMASDLKYMRESLDKLTSHVKDLLKMQQAAQSRQELLNSELTSLRETITILTDENNVLKNKSLTPDEPTPPPSSNRCLIIGSSIIRNFDESKLPNHEVCCMPGAYMKDIDNKLKSLSQSGSRFESITIVAGGNDASRPSDDVNLETTVLALKSAIAGAKSMSSNVILSAIPPRTTPDHALENIKTLNAQYQGVALDSEVRFVHSDEHFYLRDGSINEGYLYDHVHLTLKGANKFAESLGLKLSDTGVCSFKPQQGYCYEHKCGDNENGGLNIEHAFWNPARKKANKGKNRNVAASMSATHHGSTSHHQHSAQPGHQPPQAQRRHAQQHSRYAHPGSRAGHAANGLSTLSQQQRHPVVYGRMPQQGRAVLPSGRHSHGQRDHHAYRRAGPQQSRYTADYRPAGQTPTARNTVPPSHMSHPQHQSSQPSYRQYPHRASGVTYARAAQKSKNDPGLCIYCGEDNHRHGSCRYGRPITCFICNTDGHKAKFCSYQ